MSTLDATALGDLSRMWELPLRRRVALASLFPAIVLSLKLHRLNIDKAPSSPLAVDCIPDKRLTIIEYNHLFDRCCCAATGQLGLRLNSAATHIIL